MPPPSIANSLPGHESRPCADLRRDLQLLPGEADSSGDPTWLLFDPVADRYFRISGKSHAIISRWSSRHTPETLQEVLLRAGIEVDVDEILRTAVFLESNNLLMQGLRGRGEENRRLRGRQAIRAFPPFPGQLHLLPGAVVESRPFPG